MADINDSINRGWDEFFAWLPKFVAFLVILLIGYIVAKFVGGLVARVLKRAGLDRMLERGAGGSMVMRVVRSPAEFLGTVTFWGSRRSRISSTPSGRTSRTCLQRC